MCKDNEETLDLPAELFLNWAVGHTFFKRIMFCISSFFLKLTARIEVSLKLGAASWFLLSGIYLLGFLSFILLFNSICTKTLTISSSESLPCRNWTRT